MMTCTMCAEGVCERCVDRLLLLGGREPICACKRALHEDKRDGEPRLEQTEDPFTEGIHGPGLVVDKDGSVEYGPNHQTTD